MSNNMMNIRIFWMKEVSYKEHKLHRSTYIKLWEKQTIIMATESRSVAACRWRDYIER